MCGGAVGAMLFTGRLIAAYGSCRLLQLLAVARCAEAVCVRERERECVRARAHVCGGGGGGGGAAQLPIA